MSNATTAPARESKSTPVGVRTGHIRLIVVEDNPDDALLITEKLVSDGLEFTSRRVETEGEFVAALDEGADAVLCDNSLPTFNAARALDVIHLRNQELPFVIVSGTISEDLAVEFMRRGASDYLLKDHLDRLGPAVRKALERHELSVQAWAKEASAAPQQAPITARPAQQDATLFGQLFNGNTDAVWLCDPSSLRFLQANPQAVERYGYSREEFLRMTLHDLLPPGQGLPGAARYGARHRFRDGREIDVETAANTVEWFGTQALLLVAQDVTERRAAEKELWNRVLHDPLTSLANRTLLIDRIGQSLARQRRSGLPPALILLDLDGFKMVNDTAGHAVGDLVLQEVARRIQSLVRSGDTACRLGGDEFVVLLDNPTGLGGANQLADRITRRLTKPIAVAGQTFVVGCSTGIAIADARCRGAEELLRNADVAMYTAKRGGGGSVRMFQSDFEHEQMPSLAQFNESIEAAGLTLEFRPQMDVRTGAIVALEVCPVWRRGESGHESVARLGDGGEPGGVAAGVECKALRLALKQLAAWDRAGLDQQRLIVKNSLCQRRVTDLAPEVDAALSECGIEPRRLELEISERSIIARSAAEVALQQVADLGVGIVLADVCTGPVMLNHITSLPLTGLRIDGSVVGRLEDGKGAAAIASGLATIAINSRLEIIAGGVKTNEQMTALRELGCNRIEGPLVSRPLKASEVPAFAAKHLVPGVAGTRSS